MGGHLACHDCPRHFAERNELEHHKLTHLPLTVRCLCCPRYFGTFFGMVIHLESGICESGVNLPFLNRLAAQCYQWKKYLSKEYRNELLAGDTGYREVSAQPFKCPRCEEAFPLLSSMFQHIWSPACGQGQRGGATGKLRRWIEKRTYRMRSR